MYNFRVILVLRYYVILCRLLLPDYILLLYLQISENLLRHIGQNLKLIVSFTVRRP